eukprot:Skav214294  [mRNA]  locus=scaffold2257:314514:315452:+ [translate_table: standard]
MFLSIDSFPLFRNKQGISAQSSAFQPWMTWFSDLRDRYVAAMADDPFGGQNSLRYWLHGQFVVLGTFIAVSARAGVLSWLGKVAFSWLTWLCFSLEDSARDYQQVPNEVTTVHFHSYFEANAWESASQRLGYDPQGWKVQAAALARLLVFHLWQPATYVAIFYVFAPLLWSVSPLLGTISFLVLLREAVYAGFSLWTYVKYRAFMLFSLQHAENRSWQLAYIINPDKLMVAGIANQYAHRNFGECNACLAFTDLLLFQLDLASGIGLAIGLTAQVLEPPIVVVWGLTGAGAIFLIATCICLCLHDRRRRRRS